MAKDASGKKAAKKERASKAAQGSAREPATKKRAAKPPVKEAAEDAPAAAAAPAAKAKLAKKAAAQPAPPVEKRRVVFPKDVYEQHKEGIKAPFKEQGLKWQYLGDGKGRYHKEGVNVFAQFLDDGVHYSVWGADRAATDALLRAWETLLGRSFLQEAEAAGTQATRAEAAEQESEATRLWKLQAPQPRPGEPEFFFKKRVAEWEAKKPA